MPAYDEIILRDMFCGQAYTFVHLLLSDTQGRKLIEDYVREPAPRQW